ncbi:DgyrCDS1753 [Dimorphilus gyrociliatus]|uniref:DgyrCDS1753 n=1 Tax=Dimorphilus gyrociliatus TaxID=2664684 RepID=A0A7I8VBG4_9ANNE|nr:DgyrCDS1753 [Dimorphilus gyrociliatus]
MSKITSTTIIFILIILPSGFTLAGRRTNSRRKNFNPQKKKTDYSKAVTVGAILPKSYALGRKYTTMAKQLEPFNKNFSENLNSFLHFEFKMLESTFKPSDLWRAMCDDGLFKTRFNSLIYVQTAFTSKAEILQPSSEHLMSVAQFYQIPVIVWDSPGIIQTNRERLLIQLTPSIAHQGEAMLSLLRRYGWNRFAIVTGRLSGHDTFVNTIRDLVDNSGEFFDITTTVHLPSMENETVTSELQKLQAAESRVMLLYSSKEEATQIFKVAERMKLSGKNYVWITTKCAILKSTLGAELDEDRGRFPLGMFALYYSHDYDEQVKVIEKALVIWAQAMTNLKKEAENKRILLRPSYHCNPQNDSVWKYGSIVYDQLLKAKVKLNSGEETIEFKKDGTLKSVSLKVLNLRPKNERSDEWATVGEWKSGKEVEMYDITWPGNAPAPPIGRPEKYQVKVVTLKEDPYVIYSDPDPNTGTCPPMAVLCRIAAKNLTTLVANATSDPSLYQCCSGLCIDLLKMLAEKIGFDFELFEVSDKIWGAYNADTKEWNGLIKDILDGKADMVMTSLKITPERSAAIDFSVPFLETGITIIVAVRDGVISPTAFLGKFVSLFSLLFVILFRISV